MGKAPAPSPIGLENAHALPTTGARPAHTRSGGLPGSWQMPCCPASIWRGWRPTTTALLQSMGSRSNWIPGSEQAKTLRPLGCQEAFHQAVKLLCEDSVVSPGLSKAFPHIGPEFVNAFSCLASLSFSSYQTNPRKTSALAGSPWCWNHSLRPGGKGGMDWPMAYGQHRQLQ